MHIPQTLTYLYFQQISLFAKISLNKVNVMISVSIYIIFNIFNIFCFKCNLFPALVGCPAPDKQRAPLKLLTVNELLHDRSTLKQQ